ncbi:glycosyltransferase family 4 protein [Mesorhizobium delmotii]|uniref:Putative Glycosyl transferase, group 1 family protein n=1 Tax=Mesorhizobium delmotii TaxID=1631247 RepID=A0A2P9AF44_9HYPH|nr:glycosyltransferase family 4 protein [Mesorhizobium delmotii]SJM29738.1 putative Glycosyl transferase, group 1 family protein [Mesorhizobium delmotii]
MDLPRTTPSNSAPLFVGAATGLITGQAKAFREACAAVPTARVVDASFERKLDVISFPVRLFVGFIQTNSAVYFTSSRSWRGFLTRDIPVILLGTVFRRRIINHLHGNDFESFRTGTGRLSRCLIDIMYSQIDTSVAPDKTLLSQYSMFERMKLIEIPNFFDDDIATTQMKKSRDEVINVLYLSNLIFSKGFTVAVEAVDILVSEGLPVKLTICGHPIGDADMSVDQIETYLRNIAAKDYITVAGPVYGARKADVLSKADVFVLPTTYPTEAAPISIIEAFAAGCFVVSSDHGMISRMVDGFHADLVQPTPHEIASSISRFYFSEARADISLSNRTRAMAVYSSGRYRSGIRNLFNGA